MKSKLLITTESRVKRSHKFMPPMHPGEILREEFLVPLGLSANALAMAIQVPATRIAEIVKERRGITGDTALRLGIYFRMTAQFWMNLQSHYELEVARTGLGKDWESSIRPCPASKDGVLLARSA